jgi:hypothetical protein
LPPEETPARYIFVLPMETPMRVKPSKYTATLKNTARLIQKEWRGFWKSLEDWQWNKGKRSINKGEGMEFHGKMSKDVADVTKRRRIPQAKDFRKEISHKLINDLKNEPLFKNKLFPDTCTGEVFPSIRNGRVDFYYRGGKLFSYNWEGFSTNVKYAIVCKNKTVEQNEHEEKEAYIKEADVKNIELIENFENGYVEIKKNCGRYSKKEADGVSKLCKKYSYARNNPDPNFVILDIEIVFKSLNKENKSDRIDLLLFDRRAKCLRFYEAKIFDNKEIWSREGTKPAVVEQVKRYQEQIDSKKGYINKQYGKYVKLSNDLFGLEIEEPEEISEQVPLFIFNFDRDQKQGRLKRLLKDDGSLDEIKHCEVGGVGSVKIENMWKKCN